jgi:ribosomal protein S18 acetylase RimI-like enzyme
VTEIVIRRVSSSDAGRVKAVRLRSLGADPSSFASTFATEAAFPDQEWTDWASGDAQGDAMATMLALHGDEAIGLVAAYRDEQDGSLYHVIAMWVAPEYRGRGLGRTLLNAIERWIVDAGGSTVQFDVADTAKEAASLYESSGYLADGHVSPSPHTHGITHHSLRKRLT